jgi:ABC-type polar amino acid transport system ATPase subunit
MLLKVENLYKNYNQVPALIDINLEVKLGEHLVLLGASGSGKSTLLRCLNWLEVPTKGTVCLDGQFIGGQFNSEEQWVPDSPPKLAKKRREIGMVFQGFHLFAHLNALDNIAIGPQKVLKKSKATCRELARYLLDKVHLKDHADKYPWQLSGGEQQRVAIARALAMNPKLILFDEPTSALDPRLTHEVLRVMQELAEEGMTMIVVTHEIRFAQQVADTVIFMDHGKIVERSSAAQFFTRPQHQKTQEFLSYVL